MAAVAGLPRHLSRWGLLGTCKGSEWSVVALESVSSEVRIRGFVTQVSAKLVYFNRAAQPLQVQAVFPVDESAAVYHCEARLDGRTIITHCMEKKKAEKVYKEAVAAGQTAVMAREDEDTSDILKLNLGNLPAGSRAELNLRLVMELKIQTDGGITFVLPTVLNPRYCPADHPLRQAPQTQGYFMGYFEDRTVHVPQPYSIDVKAEVSGSHRIARIISHTDPLNVTLSDDALSAQVRQDGGFKCDHDWSVLVYYNNPYAPHLLRETGDRAGTGIMKDDLLMFNFFPDIPANTFSSRNEIIFVIDRSGSMMGEKIQSAKATLLLFLKSLPAGCLFNVVSFGSTFSLLFSEGSCQYTEKTLTMACNLQAAMDADMGGTEILQPLQNVYSKPPTPGYSRQILLITDGEVWNVDQVLQLVGRHAHETRLFSVGIGHGASTALVRGAARAGRGRSEMVVQQSLLQQKVMGLVSSMVQESVQDVSIACEVEPVSRVTLVPKVPPVIFGGQHLILYARVPAATQIKSVTVRGQLGTRAMLDTLDAQHITTVHDEAKSLHRLAARAQLQQWQLDEEEDVAEDMVALSVASGVVCRRTALVGIDQESKQPISQVQPQEMSRQIRMEPAGFSFGAGTHQLHCKRAANMRAGSGSLFGSSQPSLASPMPYFGLALPGRAPANFGSVPSFKFGSSAADSSAQPSTYPQADFRCFDSEESTSSSGSLPRFGSALSSLGNPPAGSGSAQLFKFGSAALDLSAQSSTYPQANLYGSAPTPSTFGIRCEAVEGIHDDERECALEEQPLSGLLGVVCLQRFDGSWMLQDAAQLTNMPLDALYASNPTKGEAAWATALVLVLLERKFGEQRDQWGLLATKAQTFITGCGEQVEDLLAKARLILDSK